MYSAPNYAEKAGAGLLPARLRGLVHENPFQLIQGGAPGEHYHMTKAEHDLAGLYSEPVMMPDGTYVTIDTGDIVMALVHP